MNILTSLTVLVHICGACILFQPLPFDEADSYRLFLILMTVISGLMLVLRLLFPVSGFGSKLWVVVPVAIFWVCYAVRFYVDAYVDEIQFGMTSRENYLIYIFAVSLVAFIVGSLLSKEEMNHVHWNLILGGLLAAVVISLKVGTLDDRQSLGRFQTVMLGSIWMGHLAVTVIVICLCFWAFQELSVIGLALSVVAFPLAVGLFLKASSRSPVVGLAAALSAMVLAAILQKSKRALIAVLVFACVGVPYIVYAAMNEESNIARISSLGVYLDPDNSGGRSFLYERAWEQFLLKPMTGYSLEVQDVGPNLYYPHNIILEAFMSTGILGGLCLLLSVLIAIGSTAVILRKEPGLVIYGALFLQMLVLGCLSSSLASAFSFWFFLGNMLGAARKLKIQEKAVEMAQAVMPSQASGIMSHNPSA